MNSKQLNVLLGIIVVALLAGMSYMLIKNYEQSHQKVTVSQTQENNLSDCEEISLDEASRIDISENVQIIRQNGKIYICPKDKASNTGAQKYETPVFSVNVPRGWVIQNHVCADMGGTDCTNLAPAKAIAYYKQKYGNDSLSLAGFSSFKTTENLRQFLEELLGAGPFAEDKQLKIKGYDAVYIKKVVPDSYVDYYYAVAHGDNVVFFGIRTLSKTTPNGKSQVDDYSEYLPDFQSIVNSITFK